jgi:hypothetical protein
MQNFLCFYSIPRWCRLSKTFYVSILYLGGADYAKLLPAGSYVDALSQSPSNLAHFIKYLDANPSLYSAYFQVFNLLYISVFSSFFIHVWWKFESNVQLGLLHHHFVNFFYQRSASLHTWILSKKIRPLHNEQAKKEKIIWKIRELLNTVNENQAWRRSTTCGRWKIPSST